MKEITNKEELKKLYDEWAMTFEGMLITEEDEKELKEWCGTPESEISHISGKVMNDICGLTGSNAYPEDLSIISVYPFKGLAMQYGARWMTDIIDNNANREKYHPFKTEEVDEGDYEDYDEE